MTTTSQPQIFTLSEFLALPETNPASEFILGSMTRSTWMRQDKTPDRSTLV